MVESAQKWSEDEGTGSPRVWRTDDVGQAESFDYYREGICSAFMPLRPELDRPSRGRFQAVVQSHQFNDGVLNTVAAQSHQVCRGRREIAASQQDCVYINLQMAGQCRINQRGSTQVLNVGEVGIFDSSAEFQLDHDSHRRLGVASLMLSKSRFSFDGRSPLWVKPGVLSRHPLYGHLIAETMSSLAGNVSSLSPTGVSAIQAMIVSLIEISTETGHAEISHASRAAAQLARVKQIIRFRCSKLGFSAADCAAEAGLSLRYVYRLFELDDESFGTFLTGERLMLAARMLRSASKAHIPIATISLECGFLDQSHFSRSFRSRYGMTPGQWRNHQF